MLWVKSSQRRNSPRINRFQQENRARERKGFGRRRMRFGEQNLTTLSLYPTTTSFSFSAPIFGSVSLSSISLSISFVPPSLSLVWDSFFVSLHSPASGSGIDLWLHAVCFLLWNCLDIYVIPCNYKSVTSAVCDLNVPNTAFSCVPFDLFSNDIQGGCSHCCRGL